MYSFHSPGNTLKFRQATDDFRQTHAHMQSRGDRRQNIFHIKPPHQWRTKGDRPLWCVQDPCRTIGQIGQVLRIKISLGITNAIAPYLFP